MSKTATVNNNMMLAQDAARDLATAARAFKEAGRALTSFMRKCDQMMETCGKIANDDAAIVGLDAMWFDLKKIGCATDLASVSDASTALATETAPCLEEASRILQKLVEWQRHVDATPELKSQQSAKERAADEGLAVVSALAVTTEALGRNYGNHGTRVGNAGKQLRSAKGYISQFVSTPYADFNKQVKARMRAIKASAATSSGSLGLNGSTSGPGLPLSPMTANRGPLSPAAAGMGNGVPSTMSAGPLSPPTAMSPMSSAPVSVRA